MSNRWTRGQLDLWRALVGLHLGCRLLLAEPVATGAWRSPLGALPNLLRAVDASWAPGVLAGAGFLSAMLFALGMLPKVTGLVGWFALACLASRGASVYDPSLLAGGVLVAWYAATRRDAARPVSPALYGAAWIAVAATHGAFEPAAIAAVAVAGLAWFNHARLLAWLALAGHLAVRTFWLDAPPAGALWLAQVLLFDPAWIARPRATAEETLFYDGHCGLCHRFVAFAVAEGEPDDALVFAPIGGARFQALVPDPAGLPDSIVVVDDTGRQRIRSDGALWILRRLGGYWRPLAAMARVVPRPLRDFGYDRVARVRHALFQRPNEACPVLPPPLRARFRD